MNPQSMGMMGGGMGGMGAGMNPMMMNPMMGMGDGMNQMMGMPGMGMGMGGMGGMHGMGGPGMGGPGMGPGMGMGGPGMAPPAGPMGGGPGGPMGGDMGPDGRFYKTKMCHKFQEGSCPYGPTCKYAHGPADLRQPGAGGAPGPRPAGAGRVMTPNGPPAGMAGPGMGMGGAGMAQPRPPSGNAGGGGGEKGTHWRTRLCEGFMQNGTCKYGDKCTFAHGHEQLRQAPQGNAQRGNQGGQKRAMDQGGSDANKRQKAEPVVPPAHEAFPSRDGVALNNVQARFAQLQQEANKFARDTGYSVALFSVGGVYTDEPENQDDHCCLSTVRTKDSTVPLEEDLKVAVLKYATGGVASQLISRAEITKFVAQRGVKAMADMYQQANQEASA